MTAIKKKIEPCPHCGKKDFYSAATRGVHLRFVHGIAGKRKASRKRTNKLAVRKVTHNEPAEKEEQRNISDLQFGYLVGRVEELIQGHANSFGVSSRQLTRWVAEALHPTPSR